MIPVFKPHIGPETIRAATEALNLGWLGMGSYVEQFESKLSAFLQLPSDRRVVAVNTCTSALHLALRAAGVGPGDEVITPSLNNIADFQAIGMCGAKPVFVDVREDSLNIDPDLVPKLMRPQVKAIIPLHYMGIPCQLQELLEMARSYSIRVVEDAAHAIGSKYEGEPVGSRGDLTCFSFDPIKTMTCIDGGAIVTSTPREAESLFPDRLLGMTQSNANLYRNDRAGGYDVAGQGFRYHLANLHAAIGLTQLEQLPHFIARRRHYCQLYNQLLAGLPGIVIPSSSFEDVSVFHYVIRVLNGRRSELGDFLRKRDIETGIHWRPAHSFSWLKDCRGSDDLPITTRIGNEILTLPLWSTMDEDVIMGISSAIRSFWGD